MAEALCLTAVCHCILPTFPLESAMTAVDDRATSLVGRAWAAWCRFWFTPADPTPLCLMRIVAGLLVLYVHVAYTFDLHALFGPDGWVPTAQANQERREW